MTIVRLDVADHSDSARTPSQRLYDEVVAHGIEEGKTLAACLERAKLLDQQAQELERFGINADHTRDLIAGLVCELAQAE